MSHALTRLLGRASIAGLLAAGVLGAGAMSASASTNQPSITVTDFSPAVSGQNTAYPSNEVDLQLTRLGTGGTVVDTATTTSDATGKWSTTLVNGHGYTMDDILRVAYKGGPTYYYNGDDVDGAANGQDMYGAGWVGGSYNQDPGNTDNITVHPRQYSDGYDSTSGNYYYTCPTIYVDGTNVQNGSTTTNNNGDYCPTWTSGSDITGDPAKHSVVLSYPIPDQQTETSPGDQSTAGTANFVVPAAYGDNYGADCPDSFHCSAQTNKQPFFDESPAALVVDTVTGRLTTRFVPQDMQHYQSGPDSGDPIPGTGNYTLKLTRNGVTTTLLSNFDGTGDGAADKDGDGTLDEHDYIISPVGFQPGDMVSLSDGSNVLTTLHVAKNLSKAAYVENPFNWVYNPNDPALSSTPGSTFLSYFVSELGGQSFLGTQVTCDQGQEAYYAYGSYISIIGNNLNQSDLETCPTTSNATNGVTAGTLNDQLIDTNDGTSNVNAPSFSATQYDDLSEGATQVGDLTVTDMIPAQGAIAILSGGSFTAYADGATFPPADFPINTDSGKRIAGKASPSICFDVCADVTPGIQPDTSDAISLDVYPEGAAQGSSPVAHVANVNTPTGANVSGLAPGRYEAVWTVHNNPTTANPAGTTSEYVSSFAVQAGPANGAAGPAGPAGPAGKNGSNGSNGSNGAQGPAGQNVTLPAQPGGKPIATTGVASGIGSTSAKLGGTISTQGLATSYRCLYGTSTSLGHGTTLQSVAGSSTPLGITCSATGLKSGKLYYFRVVATNRNGTSYGAVHQFHTKSAKSTKAKAKAKLKVKK